MLDGRPVVVLDSDDVLGRCQGLMAQEIHKITGRFYEDDDIKTWEFFDSIDHPEHPTLREEVHAIMRSQGWCLKMEPFPGAIEGVKRLHDIAEVYVCTSPFGGRFWEGERREWLYKHFGIKGKQVLQGHAKFLVHAEFFVDDKPANVEAWASYNKAHALNPGDGLLWDRPFNRVSALERVRSWGELFERVAKRLGG